MTRAYLPVAMAAAAVAAGVLALLDRVPLAVALLGLATVLAAPVLWQLQQQATRSRQATAELAGELRRWAVRLESAQSRSHSELRDAVVRESRRVRQSTADRQRTLLRAVEEAPKAGRASLRKLESHLGKQQSSQTRELEALAQLLAQVAPRAPLPSSGQWALDPTGLLELWHALVTRRPAQVLELGGGTSSVWIGYALEQHRGRLVSVDHDAGFAEQTRQQLRRHGLDSVVEVRHAPLQPVELCGETYEWYDVAAFADLADVDMLVVDGPPGKTGPQARYPALPVLAARLAPDAAVLLDDTDRPDEQEILMSWLASVPGLAREPATIGALSVLRYQRPAAQPPADLG